MRVPRLNFDILKKSHRHEDETRVNRKKVIRYTPDTCCVNPDLIPTETGFFCRHCGETLDD